MLERSSTRYLLLLYLLDILVTLASLFLAQELRLLLPFGRSLTPLGRFTLPVYGIVAAIWSLTFFALSAYNPTHIAKAVDEAQRVILAIIASWLILAGAIFFSYRGVSRLLLGYFLILDLFAVLLGRALLRVAFKMLKPSQNSARKVLIIGAGKVGQELAEKLTQRGWLGLQIVGFLDDDAAKLGQTVGGYKVLAPLEQAPEIIRRYHVDEVVIALPLWAHERMQELVVAIQETPANIKVVPDFFALTLFSATLENLDGLPLIGLKEPIIQGNTRIIKRLMDLVISAIALIVFSPLMLLTALLVKLDSKGPIFFAQERVGEGGRIFRMYKFRTMHQGAEQKQEALLSQGENGQIVFNKKPDDPRVTRVGRHLRRLSIDELPQLFNVLKGEMSLVGPRPEIPFLVELYAPWQRKRFGVPQGMTGWWQINDRSDKPMHLHTEDDLYYIQNYSLFLDLKIMWRTVRAVLRGKGAY